MVAEWRRPFQPIAAAELDELARKTRDTVEITASGQIPEGDVVDDLAEAWRRYVHIYFETLIQQRLPNESEIAEFEVVARRRLHQSVGLTELQRAFRAGARVLLEIALERTHELDAGQVASMTLRFEDLMATAAEHAYLEEQRRIGSSRNDSGRQLLLRLLAGEIDLEDLGLLHGPIQGYDLSQPYTLVEFGPSLSAARTRSESETAQSRLETALQNLLPYSLQLSPPSGGLLLISPGDATASLSSVMRGVLTSAPLLSGMRAGMAIPREGVAGLLPSVREASRARLVGEILDPHELLHTWERIRRIDIFRDGENINAFINDAIGPLILHDERRGTQLVQSLAAYFNANASRKAAARILTVHINTLDYRLRQVQSLLGVGSLTSNPFSLHLAIRLFPLYDRTSLASE